MKNKKKGILLIVLVLILMVLIVFLVGRSFGFFKYIKEGEKVNIITINGIEVALLNEEVSNKALNLEGAYPVYDSEGLTNDPFEFSMTNSSSKSLSYSLKIVVDEEKMNSCVLEDGSSCPQLDTKYIKYVYRKNDGTYSEPMKLSDSGNVIATGVIEGKETINSSIIIWIDSEAGNEIMNSYFYGKVIITGDKFVPKNLAQAIFDENKLIEDTPTLTTSSNNSSDKSGLYKSTLTNTGDPTYYFRGNIENNYVSFAGYTWRIVRINEDGTVRLIMQDGINSNELYEFNTNKANKDNMYYSNSDIAKSTLEDWFNNNIANNQNYFNKVVIGNYFCEEAKAAYNDTYATNSGTNMNVYTSYIPNFSCEKNGKDTNGKGYVSGSIGLITYDEVVHAGGYNDIDNNNYYLYNKDVYWWTMSTSGFTGASASATEWLVSGDGFIYNHSVHTTARLRPVINLKADTYVSGSGTSSSPYVVITDKNYIPRNLNDAVMDDNTLIEDEPNLETTSELANENGLYVSTLTNDGSPTYYFRGNVENNYVDFAGFTWRIVRINEDGTVRLIMQDGINNNAVYVMKSSRSDIEDFYYSNSDVGKLRLEEWYNTNIANNVNYVDNIAIGNYYCEQAKVAYNSSYAAGSGADMIISSDYKNPNFMCSDDKNEYGLVNSSIGLINYDEVLHAGGYSDVDNNKYYLYNNSINWWVMSPVGFYNTYADVWYVTSSGSLYHNAVTTKFSLRPVINLKTDTIITGLGTSSSPYKVK